jgi:hypothetical protein
MSLNVRDSIVIACKLPMLLDREPVHASQLLSTISDRLPLAHVTPAQALVEAAVHTSVLVGTSPEHFHPDSAVCVELQRPRPWHR